MQCLTINSHLALPLYCMYSLFTYITVAQTIWHKFCSHVGLFWIITPHSLVGEYKCVRVPTHHTTRWNKTLYELHC
jgi:hypothetical protein